MPVHYREKHRTRCCSSPHLVPRHVWAAGAGMRVPPQVAATDVLHPRSLARKPESSRGAPSRAPRERHHALPRRYTYTTMSIVPSTSGRRILSASLTLLSCVSLSQAFGGISARTVSRTSPSAVTPATSGWRHHAHNGLFDRPPVGGVPPRTPSGLRSTAGDDGQGGEMGDGGDGGMFRGIQEWWEREGKSDIKIYATSLAIALVVRSVALEPRFIPSLSMFPTFEIGDQLAVDKLSNKLSRPYQRKDVVVFYPPPKFSEFSNRGKGDALIKRVIAVGGDNVQIKDGSLFVNGQEQFEDYTFEEPEYRWGPQTVPEGMVMVLGDNRNHSLDSHIWGFLPTENVIGRAIFKYWPPWRVGAIET